MRRHLQSASHLKAERACDETRGGVAISDTFTKMASHMFPDSEVAKCFAAGRTKTTQVVIVQE